MTVPDGDLVERLAARDGSALSGIYDRHNRSVYGYALLLTRRRREARRVLERTFTELARAPERASSSTDLRVPLLAVARGIALEERGGGRRRWFRVKASAALSCAGATDLGERLDRSSPEEAEEFALRELEGIGVQELLARVAPVRVSGSGTLWTAPPHSLRAPILLKGREASQPARRYVRWALEWALLATALALAFLAETRAPRLPETEPGQGREGGFRHFRKDQESRFRAGELIELLGREERAR